MTDGAVTDLTRGVYRRLYGGFITGQRINRLSLNAEAWFWRVLVSVDDFGNGRADPELCRAKTAGNRRVTTKQVSEWLKEMQEVGLIEFYTTVKGELLLHVVGFEDTQPAGKNGRKIKRFDFPVSLGESKGIQGIPDVVSASDTDTDTEDHSENDQQRAKPRADKRGTRLPDDFCLNSEMREWAAEHTPHVDLVVALAEFSDYWRGVPGQRGKKLDWLATWRNRMRELEGRKGKYGANQPTGYQTAAERRDAGLKGRLAIVEELRRESVGADNEDVRGQSSGTRGR